MNDRPHHSFLGVMLGFTGIFLLFVKRRPKPVIDDAETLLQHAQFQMRESQAKNRERAVQAITAKNQLQASLDQIQKIISRLEERAEAARQEGNVEREQYLLTERGQYLRTLTQTQASLTSAIETTEAVKTTMRQDEERVRAQTAQALSMKAQHRQAQIEFAIEKSRLEMTTTEAGELFKRAQSKIQQAQARRDLLAQIRKTAEVLDVAAETAARNGDEKLRRQLLSERDGLKKAALNPKLWGLD